MSEEVIFNTDGGVPIEGLPDIRVIVSEPVIGPNNTVARCEVVARSTFSYANEIAWLTKARKEIEAGNTVMLRIMSTLNREEDFDTREITSVQ